MEIQIKNYNNIKELNYDLEDEKINFLFGMSGCGKSSIALALSNDDYSSHIPYGMTNTVPFVKTNNHDPDYDNFHIYNYQYMQAVLFEKTQKKDIYNILIGDTQEIENLKDEYSSLINDLVKSKDEIFSIIGKISMLVNELKIAYKKDNTYRASCLIGKVTANVEQKKLNFIKNKKITSKKIKWLGDGTEMEEYANNKCPFCNRKITDSKKQNIERLLIFDAKSFEKVNSYNHIFSELNIIEPNWLNKREVHAFNKQIHEHYCMLSELENIMRFITLVEKTDISVSDLKIINVSHTMKKYYPTIANMIQNFNSNYGKIRKKIAKIKKETDKMLNEHSKEINDCLNFLGLNYRFIKTEIDDNNKEASFAISVIGIKENKDRVENLSFGERNIIGMILFLVAHKVI